MSMQRRDFLKAGVAAAAAAGLAGCAGMPGGGAKARVVVVGGGYGGATAAKYIRILDPSIEVVLVEPNEAFVSCPISNLVLGGFKSMADITTPYTGLSANHGVRIVRDMATAIDADKRQVRLAKGETIGHMADGMSLSVKTVSTYRTRVLEKLKLSSNSELTYYAMTNGLIQ